MVQAELKRPFKFRVWNSNEYCFDDPRGLEVFDKEGELHYLLDNHNNFYTIQQCTGVQDINGKDIYEGDFVTGSFTKEYGAVYWDRNRACFSYISNNLNAPIAEYIKRLEVIGNIYEGVSKEKENKPKELQIGDEVTVECQSALGSGSKRKITDIKTKYDEDTGIPYKVYATCDHRFDGRNGWALNPPTAYYIKELQEEADSNVMDDNELFTKEVVEMLGLG